MITCHRSNLEARCLERGYTLEEVMPCVVAQDGDQWTIDVEHPAYPKAVLPGLLQRITNFTQAAVQHVAAGMPTCTEDEIAARHDVCLKCEHLTDGGCALCGCPVSRAAGYFSKLAWADQSCPAGKWGAVSRSENDPHRNG
jgi:hypothetical protein